MRARATVAFGIALIIGGGAFDVPSLFVPGIAIVLLAGLAAAWVALAARAGRVRREHGPVTVAEGEPYPLALRVSAGSVPLPGGRVLDPVLAEPLALGPRAVGRLRAEVSFARRGRRRLAPPTLEIEDPLRIARRRVRGRGETELLVLPRTEPVLAAEPDGGDDGGRGRAGTGTGGIGLEAAAVDLELDGLRPYRQGSPASRIHWPTVARRGEVVELRLVAGADRLPLVAMDSGNPEDGEALDSAVRAAASLCVHIAGIAGGCSLLLSGEERTMTIERGMEGWPRAHARLALVEAARTVPSVRRAARASTLYWVTARPLGRLPRALAGLRGACVVVTPAASPAAPPASPSPAARAGCWAHARGGEGGPGRHEGAGVRSAGRLLRAALGRADRRAAGSAGSRSCWGWWPRAAPRWTGSPGCEGRRPAGACLRPGPRSRSWSPR